MSSTGNRQGQPSTASLILIAGSLFGTGCAAKVELGQTNADGTRPTSFQKLRAGGITAIDLLLMIDNSSSMADKQATLAVAVPQLLGQLVTPNCVDTQGNPNGSVVQLGAANPCIAGTPEFNPINNIHIGIVTSSLGDHGAKTLCSPGDPTPYFDPTTSQSIVQPPDVNDRAHLMGTLDRATAARSDPQSTYAKLNLMGFLEWGDATLPNAGGADLTAANLIFRDLVASAHEVGCGYEAQLEGWFRFLIDPVPPILPLAPPNQNSQTHRTGSDDALLNQRAAFLRPDSLVAIVMLTDENDCSIRDTDVGWVSAVTTDSITRGSDQCAVNPNDRCCYSCTAGAPAGCTPACVAPATPSMNNKAVDDSAYQAGLRCWNQKRRFGYEFLNPKSRYVVGLTKKELCPDQSFGDMDCDCTYAQQLGAGCDPGARRMPNPLYSTIVGTLNNGQQIAGYPSSVARSDNSQVFIAGIVGVPWQDIGRVNSNGVLEYIPVTDPAWTSSGAGTQPSNPPTAGANGIWDMIYGNDNANIAPKDVHMVEAIEPRNGLPGPAAAAYADPFNGHEYNTAREDLEYACIYPLPASRPCQCDATDSTYASCKYLHPNDCCDQTFQADGAGGPGGNYSKPICNATTQVAAKAYPGLREIAVLKDYATSPNATQQGNSIVASSCPQDLTSAPTSPGYGYNPAVSALISRIKEPLKGACLPRQLDIKSDGSVPCVVAEAVPPSKLNGAECASYCTSNGRKVVSGAMVSDVTAAMQNGHVCDSGPLACASMCICQLSQETGTDLTTCQTDTTGADVSLLPGFCYVDPDRGAGNPALVGKCPDPERRNIRFVGNNPTGPAGIAVPLAGSFVYLSCSSSYN